MPASFPCVRGLSDRCSRNRVCRRVFPLRAGVIDADALPKMIYGCVSPACGGYLGYIERVNGK